MDVDSDTESLKEKLQRKLDRAEERKEKHLTEIKEKAKHESEKIDENNFVQRLKQQLKVVELTNSVRAQEERRRLAIENRKKKYSRRH